MAGCISVEGFYVHTCPSLLNSAWRHLTPSPPNVIQWEDWFTLSMIQAIVFGVANGIGDICVEHINCRDLQYIKLFISIALQLHSRLMTAVKIVYTTGAISIVMPKQ